MNIAFMHYHLKTGGVTTVLKQQIAALAGSCKVLVLTGDRAQTALPCPVVEIPELGYDRNANDGLPQGVAAKVLNAVDHFWRDGCDVLHVHNPTLAKNRHFLKIIKELQQSGLTLLLQLHDFAEDGRPHAYFNEAYPQDCHYAVINSRDARFLTHAGLDPAGVHYLPNAIRPLSIDGMQPSEPLVIYPVRAIRRKNLGEAILLSLFLQNKCRLAVTQPPNSARDMAAYRVWKEYVAQKRLKVDFDKGRGHDFSRVVGSAQSMVTTSISEGFGFTFLEPWTAGKLLWGRRLPASCVDFEASGLDLSSLYERMDVRLDWLDAHALRKRWCRAVVGGAHAYAFIIDPDEVRQAFDRLTRGGVIDFGMLNEYFQRQIIARVLSDPVVRNELLTRNPFLSDLGVGMDTTTLIEINRAVVLRHFSLESNRQRLLAIYDQVIHHPVRHQIDKKALWQCFFDLDRFSLLQWDTPGRDFDEA